MSALVEADVRLSVDEYIKGELVSEKRHEYVGGQVYAMAGASEVHNTITLNLGAALHAHLEGHPCRAYVSDMKVKVRTAREELFYYPDVMVACDPPNSNRYWREQPKVIIEVTSPDTARIDLREKNWAYQTIPSLEVYVMVSQSACEVTVYRRADDWKPEVFRDAAGSLALEALGFDLPFARLYARTGIV